jgi:hypothetical protein
MAVPGVSTVASYKGAIPKLKAYLQTLMKAEDAAPPKAPDPPKAPHLPETNIPAGYEEAMPKLEAYLQTLKKAEDAAPTNAEGFTLLPLGEPYDPAATKKKSLKPPKKAKKLSFEVDDPDDPDLVAAMEDLDEAADEIPLSPMRQEYVRPAGMGIREHVAILRSMADEGKHKPGVARAIGELESRFARLLSEGKVGPIEAGPEDVLAATTLEGKRDAAKRFTRNQITRDYTDYLAANGVDQRTIDAIHSGALPMDSASRAERARQIGLDPDAVWYRWDSPLKTQFKGYTGAALSKPEYSRAKKGSLSFIDLAPSKEGLVYSSHSPKYAKLGVQIPQNEVVLYPLAGPRDGIAGIDRLPPQAYDTFKAKQAEALKKKYADSPEERRESARREHLAEHLTPAGDLEDWHDWRSHGMKRLRAVRPDTVTSRLADRTIPSYTTAESRKRYTEPLMASGAKGTLVQDETGLSTAFTPAGAQTLRRMDLAPMDIRFRDARNILQSLLVPAAVAGGAGAMNGDRGSLLDGLKGR